MAHWLRRFAYKLAIKRAAAIPFPEISPITSASRSRPRFKEIVVIAADLASLQAKTRVIERLESRRRLRKSRACTRRLKWNPSSGRICRDSRLRNDRPAYAWHKNSNLQAAMAQAMQAKDVRAGLKTAASQFASSAAYRNYPPSPALYFQVQQLKAGLDALEKEVSPTPDELSDGIKKALGNTPSNLVKKKRMDGLAADLRGAILAIKQTAGRAEAANRRHY